MWKKEELEFIRQYAYKLKDKELVGELIRITHRDISLQAVRKQRRKLGIIKKGWREGFRII